MGALGLVLLASLFAAGVGFGVAGAGLGSFFGVACVADAGLAAFFCARLASSSALRSFNKRSISDSTCSSLRVLGSTSSDGPVESAWLETGSGSGSGLALSSSPSLNAVKCLQISFISMPAAVS